MGNEKKDLATRHKLLEYRICNLTSHVIIFIKHKWKKKKLNNSTFLFIVLPNVALYSINYIFSTFSCHKFNISFNSFELKVHIYD